MNKTDLKEYAEKFIKFTDELQLFADSSVEMSVGLFFESSVGQSHYTFNNDEVLVYKDVRYDHKIGKIVFDVIAGKDKSFLWKDAELVDFHCSNGKKKVSKVAFNEVVDQISDKHKLDIYIPDLEKLLAASVPLRKVFNDPHAYIDKISVEEKRQDQYANIVKFGRY